MMRGQTPSEKLKLATEGIRIPMIHDIIGYILNREPKNIMDVPLFRIEKLDIGICM